jgi:hypothetical protein
MSVTAVKNETTVEKRSGFIKQNKLKRITKKLYPKQGQE